MQPFLVELSDIFGRRPILFSSLLLFTIGCLICCVAKNFTQLLAGRTLQGIGGAGTLCMPMIILSDIVPLRERGIYNGIILVVSAIGTITGPLLGGLFAQHTTWRWAFYINFPFSVIGLIMVPFVVRLHAERGRLREKFLSLDWLGGFLFIFSSASFLIGVSWGGVQYPWGSWHTLCPILVGLSGLVGTFIWEFHGAKRPFFRVQLFKSRSAVGAYICVFLQGLLVCIYTPIFRY